MNQFSLQDLVKLVEFSRGPNRLRIGLIGPTGSGKTARVKEIARLLGLPLHVLLLHQGLPEDLFGIPRARENGTVAYHLPTWAVEASRRPMLILLDELDKAQPDVLATLLTFLWDYTVHGLKLHNETVVMVAMQPVDSDAFLASETGRALAARILWVPVSYDWGGFFDRLGFGDVSVDWEAPRVDVPYAPVNYRSAELCFSLARFLVSEGWDKEKIEGTLRGAVAPGVASDIVRILWEQSSIKKEALLKALVRDPSLVDRLEVAELVPILGEITHKTNIEVWVRAFERVFTECPDDTIGAALASHFDYISRAIDENGGSLQVLGDATAEEAAQAFEEMLQRVAEVYKARGKAKKGGRGRAKK